MPRVAPVPLHRFGRARAVRIEQRLGCGLVFIAERRRRRPDAASVASERAPSRKSVLTRERVLHVAERGEARGLGECSLEAGAGVGDVVAKRLQPALRFLLETVERAPGGSCALMKPSSEITRLKSAEHRLEKGSRCGYEPSWVGEFPCRGQEAPQSALTVVSVRSARVSSRRRCGASGSHDDQAQRAQNEREDNARPLSVNGMCAGCSDHRRR